MAGYLKITFFGIVSILGTYILWLCMRVFLFDYFTIPSSSMSPTIKEGSIVIVNKTLLGPRIYTNFHFNPKGQELESLRFKGLRTIAHNDIVAFNFPIHDDKISFRINHVYCKRVIGLPGDTIMARNGYIRNNNFKGTLGHKERQSQLACNTECSLNEKVYIVAPRNENFGWTIKNWGPLYVPRKGDIIKISVREAILYQKILEYETREKITFDRKRNIVYIGGKRMSVHTFTHNYYHLCGDYSADSRDSRYWGFVPEEYLIGIVTKII